MIKKRSHIRLLDDIPRTDSIFHFGNGDCREAYGDSDDDDVVLIESDPVEVAVKREPVAPMIKAEAPRATKAYRADPQTPKTITKPSLSKSRGDTTKLLASNITDAFSLEARAAREDAKMERSFIQSHITSLKAEVQNLRQINDTLRDQISKKDMAISEQREHANHAEAQSALQDQVKWMLAMCSPTRVGTSVHRRTPYHHDDVFGQPARGRQRGWDYESERGTNPWEGDAQNYEGVSQFVSLASKLLTPC